MVISLLALVGLLLLVLVAISWSLLAIFSPVTLPYAHDETLYLSSSHSNEPQPLLGLRETPTLALSVVVPAFNERDRLPAMIDEAIEYLVKPGRYADGVEILVVDDGSTDDTSQVALDLAKRHAARTSNVEIRVITLQRNRGKGGAVRHGVLFSRGRRILFVDADGATRFSDLTLLEQAMDAIGSQHGIVVGSRAHLVNSEAVVKRSALRNLLMHGFHVFVRTLGVGGIRDTQCGFKLFTRATAATLFPAMHLHRWSFDVELLLVGSLLGIPTREVPVDWHEVDGSKIHVAWDALGMARDLLVLRGNLTLGRWRLPSKVQE